ncbi:MAG TPA: carboxymuconolactone decarboxylase family protein [Burkholderiales bacterium]|nr:carboxymuconolactone decarboxylase family protein [Burkholderiales bacterium]
MATKQARLPYWDLSPEAVKALRSLNQQLDRAGLDPAIVDLVRLRASQVNGCVYCIDMHTREALENGETEERLDALAGWHDSPMFDTRERAALAWTESLTRVAETNAPDEDFALVSAHFSPKEISDLTFVIAIINAWTRVAIGFRQPVVNPVRATATR